MSVRSFEHVGVIVHDLEKVASFFELLGFRRGKPCPSARVGRSRHWLTGTQLEMMFVTTPDGSGALELTGFVEPSSPAGETDSPANASGLRHLAYRVDDLAQLVAHIRAAGYETVAEIVNYEDQRLLWYVRGPEGLLVELGERLDD